MDQMGWHWRCSKLNYVEFLPPEPYAQIVAQTDYHSSVSFFSLIYILFVFYLDLHNGWPSSTIYTN